MKKFFHLIIGMIMPVILAIIFTKPASTDVDYDITNVDVTVHVDINGPLLMEGRITYKFDDDTHGVFYQQNLTNNQELENQQVRIISSKNSQPVVQSDGRANNTYELSHNDYGYRFKVWHDVTDGDKFAIIYTYEITNAIINWKDTAELNFKIIGDDWDTDLDNIRVGVSFPGPVKGLKAWARGDLSGQVTVNPKKGNIIMTAADVGGDEGIEVHNFFPTMVTSQNKNIRDQNHKKYVLNQEVKFARETNERRQGNRTFDLGALALSGLFSLFTITKSFTLKKSGVKPEEEKQLPRNYGLPRVSPAMTEILDIDNKPSSRSLTTYLTELAVQKRIEINPVKIRRKTYCKISLTNKDLKDEVLLIRYPFNRVGDGKSFTTYGLKRHRSSELSRIFIS